MGLLDNSGDILIDAVLTDIGREFLARNDGSFEDTRFSLGDGIPRSMGPAYRAT